MFRQFKDGLLRNATNIFEVKLSSGTFQSVRKDVHNYQHPCLSYGSNFATDLVQYRNLKLMHRNSEESLQNSFVRKPIRNIEHGFHTSPPNYLHPALQTLIKPLMRLLPTFLGLRSREWWNNLTAAEKNKFKKARLKYGYIFGAFGLVFISSFIYCYQVHIEDMDVLGIKRKRFIAVSNQQMERLGLFQYEELLERFNNDLVPESDERYTKVSRVVNRLLEANKEVKGIDSKVWTISVIDQDDINAFVLTSGNIFVFTGMIQTCSNDDQLGFVLGHEIAHVLLCHVSEKLSYANLLSVLMIFPLLFLWIVLPDDIIALFADWFFRKISSLLLELPFSRKMETEADVVGIELSSKACFDIREAPVLLGMLQMISEQELNEGEMEGPDFLSSYPSESNRQKHVMDIIPKALDKRGLCGCGKLEGPDPMLDFMEYKISEIERNKTRMEYEKMMKIFLDSNHPI